MLFEMIAIKRLELFKSNLKTQKFSLSLSLSLSLSIYIYIYIYIYIDVFLINYLFIYLFIADKLSLYTLSFRNYI